MIRNWDMLNCFLNFFHNDAIEFLCDDVDNFATTLGQVLLFAVGNNIQESYNCINNAQLSVRYFSSYT
jgi:hypothetical protein